jgi:hypothetical protein
MSVKSKLDDSKFGKEDKRGYWKPNELIRYPNVFVWLPQIVDVLKWVPKYLFPWGMAYGLLAYLVWTYLTPTLRQGCLYPCDELPHPVVGLGGIGVGHAVCRQVCF